MVFGGLKTVLMPMCAVMCDRRKDCSAPTAPDLCGSVVVDYSDV